MRQGKLRHPWQPGKTGDLQERTGREPERFAKPIDLIRLRIVPAVLRQKQTPALLGNEKRTGKPGMIQTSPHLNGCTMAGSHLL